MARAIPQQRPGITHIGPPPGIRPQKSSNVQPGEMRQPITMEQQPIADKARKTIIGCLKKSA